MRRLRHESDWSHAFLYHGSDYEGKSVSSGSSQSVVQSLHAFGFDRLAMDIAQTTLNSGLSSDISTQQLPYDLAWRTKQWDLPEHHTTRGSSDGNLYRALREVHRTKDDSGSIKSLRAMITAELKSLALSEEEDILGIRDNTRKLLLLREVDSWLRDYVPLIYAGHFEHPAWDRFVRVKSQLK